MLTEWLLGLKIDLIVNDVRVIEWRGGPISVAGLTEDAPGIEQALSRLKTSPRPRLVLVHEPEVAERIPTAAADLILAGHTHGGQITLPFLERAIVRRFSGSRYVEGLYTINGNPVYVNRGLGCTGMPLRFRAAPEVAFIRLSR